MKKGQGILNWDSLFANFQGEGGGRWWSAMYKTDVIRYYLD